MGKVDEIKCERAVPIEDQTLMDPFIWWDRNNLRKRTFSPGEYIGWAAGAGAGSEVQYLLDARFDLFTGTLDNGDELHDDYPANGVGKIRKGAIRYEDGATGESCVVSDGVASLSGTPNAYRRLREVEVRARTNGYTGVAVAKSLGAVQTDYLNIMGGGDLGSINHGFRGNVNGTHITLTDHDGAAWATRNLPIPAAFDYSDWNTYKIVVGGYSLGVPDPAGTGGALWFINGKLFYSTTNGRNATDLFSSGQMQNGSHDESSLQTYIDPAPLATPNRSLFASDHANIEDYAPEDGGAWSVIEGAVKTALGAASPDTGSAAWSRMELEPDVRQEYLEFQWGANGSSAQTAVASRWVSADDRLEFRQASATSATIVEYIGGAFNQRAAISGITFPQRGIIRDDGTSITCIAPDAGEVISYATTAQGAEKTIGISFYGTAAANTPINWFCTRGGS